MAIFGPVYLLQVSKNDDEECFFLKQFGPSLFLDSCNTVQFDQKIIEHVNVSKNRCEV